MYYVTLQNRPSGSHLLVSHGTQGVPRPLCHTAFLSAALLAVALVPVAVSRGLDPDHAIRIVGPVDLADGAILRVRELSRDESIEFQDAQMAMG